MPAAEPLAIPISGRHSQWTTGLSQHVHEILELADLKILRAGAESPLRVIHLGAGHLALPGAEQAGAAPRHFVNAANWWYLHPKPGAHI